MERKSEVKHTMNGLRVALIILALAGFAVSFVALVEHVKYTHGLAAGPSFCNLSARVNCEAVNASEWSFFLGFPIASWGILFYLSLLGLSLMTISGRHVLPATLSNIALLAGVVSSIVSLALFGISEFIIGSLCILCVTLYFINFILLGVSWRLGEKGRFVSRLRSAVRSLLIFVRTVFAGSDANAKDSVGVARICFAMMVCVAAVAVFLPSLLVGMMEAKAGHTGQSAADPVLAWRMAPIVTFDNRFESGAFGDYSQGPAEAPVQIVEFADFECPACRRLYHALEPVLKKYEGKYRLVFRNYPLDTACNPGITREFHRHACSAAMFTRCAGEQGKFWEAMDFVFTFAGLESVEAPETVESAMITEGGRELALDGVALGECMSSKRYLEKIRQDISEGDRIGLKGTPSIWINGRIVERPNPVTVEKIFEEIVGGSR